VTDLDQVRISLSPPPCLSGTFLTTAS
jgi:hypothetical protein